MEPAQLNYYEKKDSCRKGLLQYLDAICGRIRLKGNLKILDIGCGTGVPTLRLAETFPGQIIAIDNDPVAVNFLNFKINNEKLQDRIQTVCKSFSDFKVDDEAYDIIIAEGFLNVIGFDKGFARLHKLLKKGGYLIIHDEYKDHDKKCRLIDGCNCSVAETLYLGELVWWNDYYRQLEIMVNQSRDSIEKKLFHREIKEIETYKKIPEHFRSMYYLVKKLS